MCLEPGSLICPRRKTNNTHLKYKLYFFLSFSILHATTSVYCSSKVYMFSHLAVPQRSLFASCEFTCCLLTHHIKACLLKWPRANWPRDPWCGRKEWDVQLHSNCSCSRQDGHCWCEEQYKVEIKNICHSGCKLSDVVSAHFRQRKKYVNSCSGRPQGSVSGPVKFIICVIHPGNIFNKTAIRCHCYVDDDRLYLLPKESVCVTLDSTQSFQQASWNIISPHPAVRGKK